MLALAAACLLPNVGIDLRKCDVVSMGGEYLRVETRVNEFTASDQSNASLFALPSGKTVVAWESRRQMNGLSGVLSRAFDKYGAPLSTETLVSKSEKFPQRKPSAISFGGSASAFYETSFRDGNGTGIFAGERGVNNKFIGEQTDPVCDSFGETTVAVWSSEIDARKRRIFARLFDAAGKPLGNEFRVSDADSGVEVCPTVACADGKFFVAWQRFNSDGKPDGIIFRAFDMGGAASTPSAKVRGANSLEPCISATGKHIILSWNEAVGDGNFSVRAQRIAANGSALGNVFAADKQQGSQNAAAVACREDGSFVLAWNLLQNGNKSAHIRVFSPDSRIQHSALVAKDGALAEGVGTKRIAFAADGSISVVWSGDGGLGDSSAVHLSRFIRKENITSDEMRAIGDSIANSAALLQKQSANARAGGSDITMKAESADPHEPPIFDPKYKRSWDLPRTAEDGPGFIGVTNTGWTPPDPHLAVGPNNIVVMTNGAIAFFNKDGTRTFFDEIENTFGFWGSLGAENFVFDPEAIYDPHSGRFMAMAAERASTGSYFLLAVSDDSDPNGVWYKYRINVTALAGSDIDSPNIAVDKDVVYLSADFFTGGQKYLVYMMRKSDLLSGGAPVATNFLITGTQSHGIPITWDSDAPAQYMIEHFEASNNTTVRLHAIKDALTSPTRVTFNLTVPAYGPPENPPQMGTSTRPTTFDSRFWSCVYRNGSLWATHHVNATNVRARWYQIKMNGWPNSGFFPELVQSGEITPAAGVRTFFSSINVDGNENAAVVMARSSPSEFISMYRAMRKSTDPPGTMDDVAIVKTSNGPYTTSRWGDYSGCATDPSDHRTFWGHHEWHESGAWRTWVVPFAPGLQETTIAPTSLSAIRGIILSGNVASLANSDDNRLVVRPGIVFSTSEAPVQLVIEGTAPTTALNRMTFTLESFANVANIQQRLELYNFVTNIYETADVRPAPTSETSANIIVNGVLSRFVETGTLKVRAKISYRAVGPVFSYPWTASIDQAVWNVGQ